MAAISVTAASVIKGAGATTDRGIAGGTITAGMPLYIDASDSNKLKAADANLSAAAATVVGISLHAALAGQPIEYITAGPLTLNAVLTASETYIAGAGTAGDINPIADLASGWYVVHLGVALSTTSLLVRIFNPGVAKA